MVFLLSSQTLAFSYLLFSLSFDFSTPTGFHYYMQYFLNFMKGGGEKEGVGN